MKSNYGPPNIYLRPSELPQAKRLTAIYNKDPAVVRAQATTLCMVFDTSTPKAANKKRRAAASTASEAENQRVQPIGGTRSSHADEPETSGRSPYKRSVTVKGKAKATTDSESDSSEWSDEDDDEYHEDTASDENSSRDEHLMNENQAPNVSGMEENGHFDDEQIQEGDMGTGSGNDTPLCNPLFSANPDGAASSSPYTSLQAPAPSLLPLAPRGTGPTTGVTRDMQSLLINNGTGATGGSSRAPARKRVRRYWVEDPV